MSIDPNFLLYGGIASASLTAVLLWMQNAQEAEVEQDGTGFRAPVWLFTAIVAFFLFYFYFFGSPFK